MLFALPRLFILSLYVSILCGSDVTEKNTEVSSTATYFPVTTGRPHQQRHQSTGTRNDQLLSLLALRRRQIIQNRFRHHIKSITDLAHKNYTNITRKNDQLINPTRIVNVHLNLSDLLQNSVSNNSGEQTTTNPNTENNVVNVEITSLRSVNKTTRKNAVNHREPPQIQENKNGTKQNMPIIRNILYRRKMSFLNRKLPLDYDPLHYDIAGLPEIDKASEDLLTDVEDSLQVEESSHDKFIYYDVKNNSSKKSVNNFEDVSEETKAIAMSNKTHHHHKNIPNVTENKEITDLITTATTTTIKTIEPNLVNKTRNTSDLHLNGTVALAIEKKEEDIDTKSNQKENKTDSKVSKNNTHFMPQSLYNYFRPPEDIPAEEMQPFLHFGEKLPISKQNVSKSIPKNPRPTQITPKMSTEDNATHKDEEEVDEHMDVGIVKPIYENKIPKVSNPTHRVTVVQQYMKNRSQNATKAAESRNAAKPEKKVLIYKMPQLRNSSRHRGFRNRTIFFYHGRNGTRQTIHLQPNGAIANLKPTNGSQNISSTTINKITTVDENNGAVSNASSLIGEDVEPKDTVIPIVTTKIVRENTDKTTRTQPTTEISATTVRRTSAKSSTTVISPTTRILSTDVVTSISIKSSISDSNANKTKDVVDNIKEKQHDEKVDPESTVIAALNNFTSQGFGKPKILASSFSIPASTELPSVRVTHQDMSTTSNEVNNTSEIEQDGLKPQANSEHLGNTDFIINVPDTTMSVTEIVLNDNTEAETLQTEERQNTTEPRVFDDIQIKSRINNEDAIAVEEIASRVTSTISLQTRETTTLKSTIHKSIHQPTVPTTDLHISSSTLPKELSSSVENNKNLLDLFNNSIPITQESESELPLATLFNVIDFKRSDYTNNNNNNNSSVLLAKIIPGVETVISRKNENDTAYDNIHAAYILASLGLIPMAVIVIYIIRNIWMKRKHKCFDDFETELQDDKATIITPVTRLPTLVVDSATKWEFPRSKLRLQTLLGQGNFGQVWKAEADDLKGHIGLTRLVAVKTIKDGAGSKERDDLLKELAIMQKMGSHPNVVTLLGCCTEKEPYLLIMEYVMYGKLLTYLRDHRTRRDYFNFSDDAATLTSRDLTVFAYCVARGMEYLSSKGIIHRDLAARNILVDHNKLCKIADFGMSRDCHGEAEVTEPRQPRNALPVRWMAIESLLYSVFTYKTDVWSFGILLWEIVTLGSSPYANMSGREVMKLICDGYRLERPNHCKPELYRVMSRTWHVDPDQRPTFAELRTELADMLENTTAESSYVDLESFRADSTVYEIDNCTPRGNYFTVKSRFSEFECDI